MALAELITRLERDAQDRVRAVQERADAEVQAIDDATQKAVAEIVALQYEQERTERERVRQRELAMARRRARARELEAERLHIGRILNRAHAVVPEIAASPAYLGALAAQLQEALSFLDGLQPRVRCQAAFAPLLQAGIERHAGAKLAIDASVGPGFVAEAADGSVIVDGTLATRLARAETRLAMMLARKLIDDGH